MKWIALVSLLLLGGTSMANQQPAEDHIKLMIQGAMTPSLGHGGDVYCVPRQRCCSTSIDCANNERCIDRGDGYRVCI